MKIKITRSEICSCSLFISLVTCQSFSSQFLIYVSPPQIIKIESLNRVFLQSKSKILKGSSMTRNFQSEKMIFHEQEGIPNRRKMNHENLKVDQFDFSDIPPPPSRISNNSSRPKSALELNKTAYYDE